MKILTSVFLTLLAMLLAACAQTPTPTVTPVPPQPESVETAVPGKWDTQTPILDEQGTVTVEITPLNLTSSGETLDFQVSLNTHSVDLSMDLAMLATLATDTGRSVQALNWDAPLGGHHVEGVLSFPAMQEDGPILDSATSLILTIVEIDAPERTFVWER